MVITNHKELAERIRLLREYGWKERYISEIPGFNTRLDELQAAVLRVKLRYLDQDNEKRRINAKVYHQLLKTNEDRIQLPMGRPEAIHVYHQYVVRLDQRDVLRSYLRDFGIGTLVHYPVPVHMQPAYRGRIKYVGTLPHTVHVAAKVLSLPMYPELSIEQIEQVTEAISSWVHKYVP